MVAAMRAFFTGITLQGTRAVGQVYWTQKSFSFIVSSMGIDSCFPSACIFLSQAFPKNRQGIAGSLVSTFVHYSISTGIGLAGAVEFYTTKDRVLSVKTSIVGIRNAFYTGMGFAGLGIVLSIIFVMFQYASRGKNQNDEKLRTNA